MQSRINHLDGLRGLAILLVIAFHAYSRWSDLVPYGNAYQDFPLFKYGWLGVQLFFMISGFVIFMTLDNTIHFRAFIYRRLLRLYPAMLFASVLIYLTASILSERPAGSPNVLSLIPGLTFIEPSWWSKLLGIKIIPLEGVFWSLYVEFKFYILAGIIYFYLGRRYLLPSLFILFIGSVGVIGVSKVVDSEFINVLAGIGRALSLRYFGWFCAGAIFYMYQQTKAERYYYMGLGVMTVSAIAVSERLAVSEICAALMVSSLFAISLKSAFFQRLLTCKIFIFFGFISYPLYLIHENAMISLIVKSSLYLPAVNMFFYPFIGLAILSGISFFIAKECEPRARRFIHGVVQSKYTSV